MNCEDCENYKPRETGWTNCYVASGATYSNDGSAGRDSKDYPRLRYSIRGELNHLWQTRAGFRTEADAKLFLAALPEGER